MSNAVASSEQDNAAPLNSFPDPTLDDWEERSFDGNTTYELVDLNSQRVLKASTENAASVLYKQQEISLIETPKISWTWKVDSIYQNINENTPEGDDFPARLYVVVQTGMLPWESLAINYVWSSHNDIGQFWNNPYTDKAIMIAVQSGDALAGQWVSQTRDVAKDFSEHFGLDIDEISGFAVMVDGDNAKKSGTAWFADISFGG